MFSGGLVIRLRPFLAPLAEDFAAVVVFSGDVFKASFY
jgi:hypothetical protein